MTSVVRRSGGWLTLKCTRRLEPRALTALVVSVGSRLYLTIVWDGVGTERRTRCACDYHCLSCNMLSNP